MYGILLITRDHKLKDKRNDFVRDGAAFLKSFYQSKSNGLILMTWSYVIE